MNDQDAPLYVNVTIDEKDEAKRLGARWDKQHKRWYLPAGSDIDSFHSALRASVEKTRRDESPRVVRKVEYIEDSDLAKERLKELRALGGRPTDDGAEWSFPADADFKKIAKWLAPPKRLYACDGDGLSKYLRYCDDSLQQSNLDKLVGAKALNANHSEIAGGRMDKTPTKKFLEDAPTLSDCMLELTGPQKRKTLDEDIEPFVRSSASENALSLNRPSDVLRAVFLVFGRSYGKSSGKPGWSTLIAVPAGMSSTGELFPISGQQPLFNVDFFEPQVKKRQPILGDITRLEKVLEGTSAFEGTTWIEYRDWVNGIFAKVVEERYPSIMRISDFRDDRLRPFDVRVAPYARNDAMVAALRQLYVAASLTDRSRVTLLESLYNGRLQPRAPLTAEERRRYAVVHSGHMGSKFGLDPSQRSALRHLLATPDGQTLAVGGPPGTGKTSMLQSVIATLVVNAALSREDRPPIVIASSATNQAVTNIIKAFASIGLPFGPADIEARWIPDIPSYGWYFPSRTKAESEDYVGFQQLLRERNLNIWSYAGSATDFQNSRTANPSLSGLRNEYLYRYKSYFARSNKTTLVEAVEGLRRRLKDLIGSSDGISLTRALDQFESLKALVLFASLGERMEQQRRYEARRKRLDRYQKLIEARVSEAKHKVWNASQFVDDQPPSLRDVLDALLRPMRWASIPTLVNLMLAPAQRGENADLARLKSIRSEALRRLARFHQRRELFEENESSKKLVAGIKEIRKHVEFIEDVANRFLGREAALGFDEGLRSAIEDVESEREDPKYSQGHAIGRMILGTDKSEGLEEALESLLDRSIRFQAFHLGARYWEGRWLLEADLAIDGDDEASVVAALRRHCMLAPVVVATAYMLPNILRVPSYDEAPDGFALSSADLMILDEAGQVAPPVAVALFALAKRCLAVGDVKQLAPIVSISEGQDNGLLRLHGFDDANRTLRATGLTMVKGSIMLACRSASYFGGAEDDVTLLRHYRCRPTIIEFCNDLVYRLERRLIPMTRDPEAPLYHPMSYVELQFDSRQPSDGSRENDGEALAIIDWLVEERYRIETHYNMLENGYVRTKDDPKYKDLRQLVALITPFTAQKELLVALVKERLGFGSADEDDSDVERAHKMVIGTVHALQGAERPIVVFSPVNSPSDGVRPFMDSSTDMLNVAVSRAQDVFILFASRELFFSKKALTQSNREPSAILGRYMRRYGKHLYPRILVVVESPNKVPQVQASLGKRCKVVATGGHIREIADVDLATMVPTWSFIRERESNIIEISALLEDMDEIVLATDDDQEGEAIAWHVLDALNRMRPMDGMRVTRMTFHDVTEHAVRDGFANRVGPWDGSRRADAALTRAMIDVVLAQSLEKTLTESMTERGHDGLYPMGRVRAALLDLLQRDADNGRNEYFISAEMNQGEGVLHGFVADASDAYHPLSFSTEDEAQAALETLSGTEMSESGRVDAKRFTLGPSEPSSTSAILIRAYEELGLAPSDTQKLLQNLYEGRS